MNYQQAKELLVECFKVIYSRFKLANEQVVIGFQTEEGYKQEVLDFEIRYDYQGFLKKEDLW